MKCRWCIKEKFSGAGQAVVRASGASCGMKWSNGAALDGGTLKSAVFAGGKNGPKKIKNGESVRFRKVELNFE